MTQPDQASDAEKAFGAAVRQRRILLGLTQEQVRRRLLGVHSIDLSKTAMSRLEQGERPIRLNEVTALAQLLRIDLRAYGGNPRLSEAEELDKALEQLTGQMHAIEQELAVASAQYEQAHATYVQATERVQHLRNRRSEMEGARAELTASLMQAADARRRFELLKSEQERPVSIEFLRATGAIDDNGEH